ncbi:MAG: hypothetical protein NXH95_18890 [Pseudomonadaceae bacterium]|nr:hypothetical protein [Pseudomonadaceae bacterium]
MSHLITQSNGITYIEIEGLPTVDELILITDKASEMENIERSLWRLKKGIDLEADDLRRVASHVSQLSLPKARAAIVASEDLAYGLIRMYLAFLDIEGVSVRVFREEEAAVAWLNE